MSLWAELGTLSSYMDFSGLGFGQSWVTAVAWSSFFDSSDAAIYIIYYSIVALLVMAFVAAAYVTVQTVNFAYLNLYAAGTGAGSGLDLFGYYVYYAGGSGAGDQLGWWEFALVAVWEVWALALVVGTVYAAMQLWDLTDARVAGAKEGGSSLAGAGTPVPMILAIKTHTLLMVAGLSALISGYALGTIVQPVLSWIFFYSYRKTWIEGTDKDTGKQIGVDGTSFENDFTNHAIASIYGYIVLAAIAEGGYYFAYQFIGLDDGFSCDLQEGTVSAATYAGLNATLDAQKDRATCLKTIDNVFDQVDLDNNGTISRCEDATLQHAFGATQEYAFKYSSPYTKEAFRTVCNKRFSS
jgi:hypothetical protein